MRAVGALLTLLALAAIATATLHHGDPALLEPHGHWCVVCGSFGTVDVVQNVVLFAPLGVGLALLGVPVVTSALLSGALSLSVELLQATVLVGRAGTLSDLLTNTAGATLARLLVGNWRRWLPPSVPAAPCLAAGLALGWTAATLATAWALRPLTPAGPYLVMQVPPEEGRVRPFEGTVLAAEIAGLRVAPGTEPPDGPLATRLASVHTLEARARVLPMSYAPGKFRPIVSLYAPTWSSVLLLGQRTRDLRFERRTNAARARVRPLAVHLRDVFPATDEHGPRASAPIDLGATHDGQRVTLSAASALGTRQARVTLSPLHGWALLLPLALDGSFRDTALSLLWMLGWLVPIGYWSAGSARRDASTFRRAAAPLATWLLALAAPWLAAAVGGLRPPAPAVLVAALAALGMGALVARLARVRLTAPPRL